MASLGHWLKRGWRGGHLHIYVGFTLEVAVIDTMMTKAIDGRKYVKMGIKTRAPSLILEAPSVIISGTWLIRFYCKTIQKQQNTNALNKTIE